MATKLDPRVIDELAHLLPPTTPWHEINVEIRARAMPTDVPNTIAFALVPRVVEEKQLVPIGASIGTTIHLSRQYVGDMDTAAGLALVAHEALHQNQRVTVPNFEALAFPEEEYRRLDAGEPIMGNKYEREAYLKEAEVYCELLARGYAPGDWMPLGFLEFGC